MLSPGEKITLKKISSFGDKSWNFWPYVCMELLAKMYKKVLCRRKSKRFIINREKADDLPIHVTIIFIRNLRLMCQILLKANSIHDYG